MQTVPLNHLQVCFNKQERFGGMTWSTEAQGEDEMSGRAELPSRGRGKAEGLVAGPVRLLGCVGGGKGWGQGMSSTQGEGWV